METTLHINLAPYKSTKATIFVGQQQGEHARMILHLEQVDLWIKGDKEFQVQFTVRGYDPMTGDPIDTGYNLATETLAAMEDLEWEMKTLLERFPEDYPMVIEEIFVRNVKTRIPSL